MVHAGILTRTAGANMEPPGPRSGDFRPRRSWALGPGMWGRALLVAAAAMASACGPRVQVRQVGPILNEFGNGAHILAMDAAYSVDTGSGTFWMFGDTFY